MTKNDEELRAVRRDHPEFGISFASEYPGAYFIYVFGNPKECVVGNADFWDRIAKVCREADFYDTHMLVPLRDWAQPLH